MRLQGRLDTATHVSLSGWARKEAGDDLPVRVLVRVDDCIVARLTANIYRPDLEAAGIGAGRHGFMMALTGLSPLQPCTIRVLSETDGSDLPGSPWIVQRLSTLDEAGEQHLAQTLGQVLDAEELDRRIAFLARQTEHLLQQRADRLSRQADRATLRNLRWRWDERAGVGPPPVAVPLRALVIDSAAPTPDRDAGSNAILSHMRALQRLGYQVCFAAADMTAPADDASRSDGIEWYRSPWHGAVEEVLRREPDGFDLIYLHRISNARYIPLIRHTMPQARLLLSIADLASLRAHRQAEAEGRPELLPYARTLWLDECAAVRSVDGVLTHSSFEAALLARQLPGLPIFTVPWAVGINPVQTAFAARRGVAFIGGFSHLPNVDAVHFLIREIMPLVWADDPTIVCHLAGSDMPADIRSYAAPAVRVHGHVDRLASLFEQVRLTTAPLTFGAGVKGKVLDSMAAGLPCAGTPIAFEGMALPPSVRGVAADTPAGIAHAILQLHRDDRLNATLAQDGLRYVAEEHSEQRVDERLRSAVSPGRLETVQF